MQFLHKTSERIDIKFFSCFHIHACILILISEPEKDSTQIQFESHFIRIEWYHYRIYTGCSKEVQHIHFCNNFGMARNQRRKPQHALRFLLWSCISLFLEESSAYLLQTACMYIWYREPDSQIRTVCQQSAKSAKRKEKSQASHVRWDVCCEEKTLKRTG